MFPKLNSKKKIQDAFSWTNRQMFWYKNHTPTHMWLIFSLLLASRLLQLDSVRVQTHQPRACGQSHRGVDPWPQQPLVKAVVVLVVGPQAFGALLSQDLDCKTRCHQALWRLPQLHVEVLTQAQEPEVDCCTAAAGVWWAWSQGSTPSALVVLNFMRDVCALVVDFIRCYNFIF